MTYVMISFDGSAARWVLGQGAAEKATGRLLSQVPAGRCQ